MKKLPARKHSKRLETYASSPLKKRSSISLRRIAHLLYRSLHSARLAKPSLSCHLLLLHYIFTIIIYNSFLALEAADFADLAASAPLLEACLLALTADLDASTDFLDASTLATEDAELKLAFASLEAKPN